EPAQPTAPPPAAPEDLSQLPTLQKIGLLFQSIAAGGTGGPNPLQQLIAQRQQQADRKRQQFVQSLGLLEKFGSVLERTPHRDSARVRDGLRKRVGDIQPGLEEYFDLLVPETGDTVGRLGAAAEDPAIQAVLQNPDWTDADLQKVL